MKTKDESLLEIRGASIGMITEQSSSEEKFQNQTLRPILKFQNELFIEVFRNYAVKQKGVYFSLSPQKKENYIESKRFSFCDDSGEFFSQKRTLGFGI